MAYFFPISVLKTQNSPPLPLIPSKRITEAFQDPWQLKYIVRIADNYICFSQCAERMANGINESFAVPLVKSLHNNMTFSQCCRRSISLHNSQYERWLQIATYKCLWFFLFNFLSLVQNYIEKSLICTSSYFLSWLFIPNWEERESTLL